MISVLTAVDGGPGSLRQAIVDASAGDTIDFSPELIGSTIALSQGELVISKDLELLGPGEDLLTISGADQSRILRVVEAEAGADVVVLISGLRLADGRSTEGGALLNQGAEVSIRQATFDGNMAAAPLLARGGAISSSGPGSSIELLDVSFLGNEAIGGEGPRGGDARGGALNLEAGTRRRSRAPGSSRTGPSPASASTTARPDPAARRPGGPSPASAAGR